MKILRYNATLNQMTGDPISTLVMLQLEYWFEIMENRVFYKYLEPCGSVHYKQGDSWTEELGISKAAFRTAFGRIGKVYKSVRAYEESEDKFEGKMYAAYVDRMKGLTFYVRNTTLVEKTLSDIEALETKNIEAKIDNSPEVKDMNLPGEMNFDSQEVEYMDLQQSKKDELHQVLGTTQFTQVEEDNLRESSIQTHVDEDSDFPLSLDNYKDNNNRLQTEKTIERRNDTLYEECIKHYHTICPHLIPVLRRSSRLRERLDHLFGECQVTLEQFDKMLAKVQCNDFLSGRMGENAWKANLEWMVQEDKFFNILEDRYQNYVKHREPTKQDRFTNISSHNWDFVKLEEIEANYIEENALDPIVANSPLMKKLYEARAELAAQGIEY